MSEGGVPERTQSTKRKSSAKSIEVQSILTGSGGGMQPRPSPAEHVTSPTASTHSNSSGRASFQGHGRAVSVIEPAVPGRVNRYSTSFPVQPAGTPVSPTRMSMSPTREAAPVVPEALASPTGPSDTSFLTAIATQERRVLELKEQLQQAESDLTKLKRQWAQHEANKKKNDARRVTQLQPLQTAMPATAEREVDEDGSSAWAQQEMERRKALLNGGRNSNRTVFQGSRHTRTLSLLSPAREDAPVRSPQRQHLPPRKESLSNANGKRSMDSEPHASRPQLMTRASTTPDLTTEVADHANTDIDLPDNLEKGIDKDALLRAGKKMAGDFRDGLWTFFEDLRQATVGDEEALAKNGQPQRVLPAKGVVRSRSSRETLRPNRASLKPANRSRGAKTPSPARKHQKSATQGAFPALADPSFWTDHGVQNNATATAVTPVKKSPTTRGHTRGVPSKSSHTTAASNASTDIAWDTWDDSSPKESRSSSTTSDTATQPSTVASASASPRQSTDGKGKEPLPWPALSKLGPATLRRTASHLMNEWEKSLTPSPGKEWSGQDDYMGLGAEAAAMSGGTGRKRD